MNKQTENLFTLASALSAKAFPGSPFLAAQSAVRLITDLLQVLDTDLALGGARLNADGLRGAISLGGNDARERGYLATAEAFITAADAYCASQNARQNEAADAARAHGLRLRASYAGLCPSPAPYSGAGARAAANKAANKAVR